MRCDAGIQVRNTQKGKLVSLHQSDDKPRPTGIECCQVVLKVARPRGPVQAVPMLAGTKGQPQQAARDRKRVNPDRVGKAGADHNGTDISMAKRPSPQIIMLNECAGVTQERVDIERGKELVVRLDQVAGIRHEHVQRKGHAR